MNAIVRTFYAFLLWATQLELAAALAAPNRNYKHISALKRDEDEYSRALMRIEMGL